jgi:hypothetical protein
VAATGSIRKKTRDNSGTPWVVKYWIIGDIAINSY